MTFSFDLLSSFTLMHRSADFGQLLFIEPGDELTLIHCVQPDL